LKEEQGAKECGNDTMGHLSKMRGHCGEKEPTHLGELDAKSEKKGGGMKESQRTKTP